MTLNEARSLIDTAVPLLPRPGEAQHWADLGCGSGLFTKALGSLLPAGSIVYGVDTNPTLPRSSSIIPIKADFEKDNLPLSGLDGILMANSLHYVSNKLAFLKQLRKHFAPGGRLIIVEYDTDRANAWVPYPIRYATLEHILTQVGFHSVTKMNETPSVFNNNMIYAAVAVYGNGQ